MLSEGCPPRLDHIACMEALWDWTGLLGLSTDSFCYGLSGFARQEGTGFS